MPDSELVERNAARELIFVFGEQQAAFRGSVVAGEVGKFLVEVLKAEAETERLRILKEQFAGFARSAPGDSA